LIQTESSHELQARDRELTEIAKSIASLAELFKDLSVLVIDQGTLLDSVEFNIEQTAVHMEDSMKELITATRYIHMALKLISNSLIISTDIKRIPENGNVSSCYSSSYLASSLFLSSNPKDITLPLRPPRQYSLPMYIIIIRFYLGHDILFNKQLIVLLTAIRRVLWTSVTLETELVPGCGGI